MLRGLRNWADALWCLGKKNDENHVRFYPNPGFTVTLGQLRLIYSWHRGWKVKKVVKTNATVRQA